MDTEPLLISLASSDVGVSAQPEGKYDPGTQQWSLRSMATTWCQTTTTQKGIVGFDPDQETDDETESSGW